MNSAGPALRDIQLPQVPWWPPAAGWWIVFGVLVIALVAGAFARWRGRRERAWRRAARRELEGIAARHANDRDDVVLAASLSRLLRRIALLRQPAVVADNETAWREFLATGAQAFTRDQIETLADAPYRSRAHFDAGALIDAARRWCDHALRPRALLARRRT